MKKILRIGIFSLLFSFFATPAFAHEAYVLTQQEFNQGIAITTTNPIAPLLDSSHMGLSAIISICVVIAYTLAILWATTPWSNMLDGIVRKAKVVGPFIIRIAISSSFFYAASANSVLGPELSLAHIPGGAFIRILLFAVSLMVFFGVFVELAALIGLVVFIYMSKSYGLYMITYLNYLGELIVLFLFGSRTFSFDRLLFGKKLWFKKIEKYKELEVPIVRVLYGLALIYAGVDIKFLHQILSVWVYNQYHLQDFFKASAPFIAAGAGVSEILIGLFIVLGFAMRFTILISLFFITISLLYFHELIWPHFMLYGISFSLLINSADTFTIDRYLIPFVKKLRKKIFGI